MLPEILEGEEDIQWDQPATSMATTCLPFSSAPKVEASRRSWFGQMLKTVDKIGVFDRTDGFPPFLILDGHGRRIVLLFL